MLNVLFTSAGRRVALLRSFRQALSRLKLEGRIIVTDIDPLAPAVQVADRCYMVPRLTQPHYIPSLIEICRREKIALVLPLIDPDIPVLAQNREQIEATGARVAVVSADAAAMTRDKWLTHEFFQKLQLRVPRSWQSGRIDSATADYPLFIKPRSGSAGEKTFKVRSAHELAFFASYVPEPMVQEFLPGPEITSDVICDINVPGRVLAIVSRQRIEVRSGEVSKGVTIRDASIAAACARIAAALPAVGPITVQCIHKDGVPHYTEINARLGGGIPLALAAGVDVPALLLGAAAGLPSDAPDPGGYRAGIYMTRYDDSFVLTEEERAAIQGNHL